MVFEAFGGESRPAPEPEPRPEEVTV
jgi:hypothetical protein